MARWLRGFLSFGVLAAPGNGGILPGDRTYDNGHEWGVLCETHNPRKLVGDLTPSEESRACDVRQHETIPVLLDKCAHCGNVFVYDDGTIVESCEHQPHPTPALEGRGWHEAHQYQPPQR